MSSRVLTGSNNIRAERVQWLTALGEPVNSAPLTTDRAEDNRGHGEGTAQELESAMQRIQVLERRITELNNDLPRRYEMGKQEGRAEGERAGAASATSALQPLLDRMAATIAELGSYRARFRRESEPELLRLALAVAQKILKRELTVDPHSLLGILKAALETINKAEVLCVSAAPEDAPLLSGRLAGMGLPDAVEVKPDRMLERGSLLIETRRGQIDAGVQTQLIEIENGFADRVAAQSSK